MKSAYTSKEIASITSVAVSTVLRRADRENWSCEGRTGRGGGKVWSPSCLPEDIRSAIALHEVETDNLALVTDNVVVPDWAHKIGMARFRLVIEWRQFVNASTKTKGEASAAFVAAVNSGQLHPAEHKILGNLSDKTLYRWDKKLRDNDGDYRVLCDRRGKWTKGGKKGNGQIGPEAEKIFLGCYLTPNKPSMKLAYEATKAVLNKHELPVPSYRTVARFAKRFDQYHHDLVVLKRHGEKALKDRVGPYIARDANLLSVGDVLFCDGHVLNFRCLHPVTGKAFRPTLICWFDWRSRMPVGWEIMPTEDTLAISSALHMAIRTLGQYPRCVYIDNGKAFRSKYFSDDNADFGELNGLYARLGIAVQYSRPYEARTKIVERWFRTFDEQCQRLLPSYIGNNIDNKPAWMKRNEKYHADTHEEWTPTLTEASEIFHLYATWYGQQPHRGMGNQLPLAALQGGVSEGVDMHELDRHFLIRQKISPKRCGFTLHGIRFESDCLYGLNMDVMAMFSWADMSEIYIHTMEGERLGIARPTEMLHPLARIFGDELDLRNVQEANKRQRKLKDATMKVVKAFDAELGESGLDALPFNRREPAPLRAVPKPKEVVQEPKLDEAEVARLEALQAKLKALPTQQLDRPDWFASEYERYAWCFEQVHKNGYVLPEDDQKFMTSYEESDEYRTATGKRFEQLKTFYSQQANAR